MERQAEIQLANLALFDRDLHETITSSDLLRIKSKLCREIVETCYVARLHGLAVADGPAPSDADLITWREIVVAAVVLAGYSESRVRRYLTRPLEFDRLYITTAQALAAIRMENP